MTETKTIKTIQAPTKKKFEKILNLYLEHDWELQGGGFMDNDKFSQVITMDIKKYKVIEYDEDGKMAAMGNVKAGEKDGKWIIYAPSDDDSILCVINYKNGEKHGKCIGYGIMPSETMYKEGLRDKFLQDYEKIKIEGEYKNGKRHGEWREYGYDYGEVDEKKILLNKDIWKNNEIVVQNGNGRWAKCFENQDSIECEGNYKNGQLDGGYIEYHEEDLSIYVVGQYKAGKKDGRWHTYLEGSLEYDWERDDATLLDIIEYKDGKKVQDLYGLYILSKIMGYICISAFILSSLALCAIFIGEVITWLQAYIPTPIYQFVKEILPSFTFIPTIVIWLISIILTNFFLKKRASYIW